MNQTLVAQIDLITNFNTQLKIEIIKKIHITFLKYVERMYKSFWKRQNNKLRQEGISENVIIKRIRDIGYT